MKHDATEHAVVIKNKSGFFCPEDEVIVLSDFMFGRSGGELPRHSEMDFEVKLWSKGEEHALPVSFGGEELHALEDSQSRSRAVTVDPRLGMSFGIEDRFPVKGRPLAAGEFDFS